MQVKALRVKNFRALEDASVELGKQTALLGGNGCGKSTFLRAMERFYGQLTYLEADDFFARDINRSVEIQLTFHEFNNEELELFESRIHNGEMTVTRIFEHGSRKSGKYYGSTKKHSAFESIRKADGANEKKEAYKAIKSQDKKYETMPTVTKGDQVLDAIEQWEASNPEECELGRDDGQFFGFANVAKGALQKATSFVFVPAVRDAVADSTESRNSVIGRLMELVVRSSIQQRKSIQEFQSRTSEEFRKLTDPENLPELNMLADTLSTTLRMFYNDSGVLLRWQPVPDFTMPLPSADVFLSEDGFEGPVDRKGHGLQRAFVVTLLQHLAKASAELSGEKNAAPGESGYSAEQVVAQSAEKNSLPASHEPTGVPLLPGLILAIEEPELYQHPTKQRHFARVLSDLSSGALPGVATSTQIIFASHSSLFVSMERFDQIRLARRAISTLSDVKTCQVVAADLSRVAVSLGGCHLKENGEFTAETLRGRLHTLDTELAEGFFANLVVLVEGVTDRAALLAAAKLKGFDCEAHGVAILCADGKTNIDRPAVIFRELGIPIYIVWDCDELQKQNDASRQSCILINRALQRLMGVADGDIQDFRTEISPRYACLSDKLESVLENELGGDEWFGLIEKVKSKYGIQKNKDALKVPAVVREIFDMAAEHGKSSNTLNGIVDSIIKYRSEVSSGG